MQDCEDRRDGDISNSGSAGGGTPAPPAASAEMAPLGLRFPLDFDLGAGQLSMEDAEQSQSSAALKGYSQKNYHIGDGTLYSVMIPHQAKQPAKTYRGSTPGRGRGRGRGRGSSSGGTRGGRNKQLKFHHQALPAEYLDHYVQRMHQEAATQLARQVTAQAAAAAAASARTSPTSCSSPPAAAAPAAAAAAVAAPHPHPLLTPDVLSAACQAERRNGGSTVRPETLSKVASVIAANSKYRQILPRPAVTARPRARGRARGRGRGRGSRAIPGFIQEVHGNMNKGQEKILVEKSSYNGDSLLPTSVSAHLVKTMAGTSALTAAAAAMSATGGDSSSLLEGRHRSRKPAKADICHMIDAAGSPTEDSKVSVLQTLLSTKREPGETEETDIYRQINEYLPLYERLLASSDGDERQQEQPLNLCIRDLSIRDQPDSLNCSESAPVVKKEEESPAGSPEPSWNSEYVFWPEAGVMVHPMMLEHHWRLQQQQHDIANWAACNARNTPPRETTQGTAVDTNSRRKKRSPVHVPPPPSLTPSLTEPADSDVSICKFKFRGGANPILQEKKKLSLNSDGQFRFFQNERTVPTTVAPSTPASSAPVATSSGVTSPDRKRKRPPASESGARQLERQFRERGFLIQTAQTESAEGATYCKFRQLKKFTKYLFRSWRDHLPSEGGETPLPAEMDTPPPRETADPGGATSPAAADTTTAADGATVKLET